MSAQENFTPTVIDKIKETVKEQMDYYLALPILSREHQSILTGLQRDLSDVFGRYMAEETTVEKFTSPQNVLRNITERVIDGLTTERNEYHEQNPVYQSYTMIIDHVKQLLPKITEQVYRFIGTHYYVIVRYYGEQVESVSCFYDDREQAFDDMEDNKDWTHNEDLTKIFKASPDLFVCISLNDHYPNN